MQLVRQEHVYPLSATRAAVSVRVRESIREAEGEQEPGYVEEDGASGQQTEARGTGPYELRGEKHGRSSGLF